MKKTARVEKINCFLGVVLVILCGLLLILGFRPLEEGVGEEEGFVYPQVNFSEADPPSLTMIKAGKGYFFPSLRDPSLDWTMNFFVAGGKKCGSTSLKHYLRDLHPNVCMPPDEINRMSTNIWEDVDSEEERRQLRIWYRDAFYRRFCNDTFAARAPGGVMVVGEKSPTLIGSATAPSYIAQAFPHAKLIIVVRNPMTAVYSHYWMDYCKFRTNTYFERWLVRFPESKDWAMFGSFLSRYLELIPKSKLLVFQMEELFHNITTIIAGLNKIQEFLQLPFHDYSQNETLLHTYGSAYLCVEKRGIRPPMKPETYSMLKDYFQADLDQLKSLLPNKTGFGGYYIWD